MMNTKNTKAKKVVFIGSKRLGLSVLKTIYRISSNSLLAVITFDDSNDKRSQLPQFTTYTKENGIDFFIVKDKKHSELLIKKVNPDLCVVVGWYWLFSKEIIEWVQFGFVGVHNSLLPHYRGGAPVVWAIINGEKRIGTSLFSFTERMDDGLIWVQDSIEVNEDDYIADVLEKLQKKIVQIFNCNYLGLLEGGLCPWEQDNNKATYCSQRNPDDGKIDWHKPAVEIYNFIRAQSEPYPGAYSYYNSEKIIIWKSNLYAPVYYGSAGQIVHITTEGILVVCGDNRALLIQEIDINGAEKKSKDFFKSTKLKFKSEI